MIYADYNASTPIDSRVLSVLVKAHSLPGNPSSLSHLIGRRSHDAVEDARKRIGRAVSAEGFRIIFTSGATEAINLAILGLRPASILVGSTEHPAVLEACRWQAHSAGCAVSYFGVDEEGIAEESSLKAGLARQPSLVAAMLANNVTGAIHPVREISLMARAVGSLVLCDASQAVGRVPLDVGRLGADVVIISGHKCYGPMGVGAMLFRESAVAGRLRPVFRGGGQEYGLRPGTENVPSIVALATAIEIATESCTDEATRMIGLRDSFEKYLLKLLPDVKILSRRAHRLPNTSCFCIPNVSRDRMAEQLCERVALSSDSACKTSVGGPSHVLVAMEVPTHMVASSFRVSFGRMSAEEDPKGVARAISRAAHCSGT